MKVRMLKQTRWAGEILRPGMTVRVKDATAIRWISRGIAESAEPNRKINIPKPKTVDIIDKTVGSGDDAGDDTGKNLDDDDDDTGDSSPEGGDDGDDDDEKSDLHEATESDEINDLRTRANKLDIPIKSTHTKKMLINLINTQVRRIKGEEE